MNQVRVGSGSVISLRRVNPSAILESISLGKYNKKPVFIKKPAEKLDSLESCTVSTSNQNDCCTYIYLSGSPCDRTVTTGNDTFNGDIVEGICLYCKTHQRLPYGICIRVEMVKGKARYLVTDRRMCRPECAISRLYEVNLPDTTRGEYVAYTQQMLCAVTGRLEPFRVLKDFRHLKCHGGTKSYEEWLDNSVEYKLLDTVIIVPTKKEYLVASANK